MNTRAGGPARRRPAPVCPSCRERVLQAVTDEGIRLLDPTPSPTGGYLAYQDAAGTWRARVTTIGPPRHPLEKRYALHAPCPAQPDRPDSRYP